MATRIAAPVLLATALATAPAALLATRNAAHNAELRAAGKPPVGLLDFDGEFMGQVLSYKRAAVVAKEKAKEIGKDVGIVASTASNALTGSSNKEGGKA